MSRHDLEPSAALLVSKANNSHATTNANLNARDGIISGEDWKRWKETNYPKPIASNYAAVSYQSSQDKQLWNLTDH